MFFNTGETTEFVDSQVVSSKRFIPLSFTESTVKAKTCLPDTIQTVKFQLCDCSHKLQNTMAR